MNPPSYVIGVIILGNIMGVCFLADEPWGYLRWMAVGGWAAAFCFVMGGKGKP